MISSKQKLLAADQILRKRQRRDCDPLLAHLDLLY